MSELSTDFFARNTNVVARDLIGCKIEVGKTKGLIVETEAYSTDAASHAMRPGKRGWLMRETIGRVYVYLIYGVNFCLNFTTDINAPGAVLIRAVEPLSEVLLPKDNTSKLFTNGPGKLCKAFGINLSFNESKIGEKIKVFASEKPFEIGISTRIGITKDRDLPWRFFAKGNMYVSKNKNY